jgi:hypothetical protein
MFVTLNEFLPTCAIGRVVNYGQEEADHGNEEIEYGKPGRHRP